MTDPQRRVIVVDRSQAPSAVRIGRGEDVDLSIDDDEYVSKRALRIIATPKWVVLQDLGSTNPSSLDGTRIYGEVRIADPGRHVLRVGRTDIDLVVR